MDGGSKFAEEQIKLTIQRNLYPPEFIVSNSITTIDETLPKDSVVFSFIIRDNDTDVRQHSRQ